MSTRETQPRQKRKSRGRGLRATTGCITCRRRHLKCNEERPQCGPCKIGDRHCVYNINAPVQKEGGGPSIYHKSIENDDHNLTTVAGRSPSKTPHNITSCFRTRNSTGRPRATSMPLIAPIVSHNSAQPAERIHAQLPGRIRRPEDQITLAEPEIYLFRHYVHDVSKLLDLYDEKAHFARIVPHIALKNQALMKALLAISALHLYGQNKRQESLDIQIDRETATGYYTDALDCLKSPVKSSSCNPNLELITTTMLVSAYELMDGRSDTLQAHLSGLFWRFQFQETNGESSGLPEAVWWAWLQQDTWLAMLERRRVFNIWEPQRSISSLDVSDLPRRALYLLTQCVNYASLEEKRQDFNHRVDRGNELLQLLDEWRGALPFEYSPLPAAPSAGPFPAIWINPISFASALQIQSLACILVVSCHPKLGIVGNNLQAHNKVREAVKTVCGVARSVPADELGANVVSLHCLCGAAMGVHVPRERLALLDLLDTCQQKLHWPQKPLRKELELEYSKQAFSQSCVYKGN